ncbi:rhodanese-like domain-containing protein [Halobacillus salinarum]|uniref:Rhodanese-like domain-containing protein n=1 Tax=Halobacillus salinarum TaxID=2932257 RepID=A0ABY4EQY0_9BACI|nr:rhodanese-like domain-containing protein [Halobacillus salinarum]UOQ46097.1 rhodanese-like domain-containing protein [Halobacillus salinarum]
MQMMLLMAVLISFLFLKDQADKRSLKPLTNHSFNNEEYCVIDIRDYIVAHHSPYPGAENIPLSYLPRALKERFDCSKSILLITDGKRGAKLAAKMIRKQRQRPIYYIDSAL